MNQKIKDRELEKRYLCVIHGTMPQREGKLEGYLWKDEVKSRSMSAPSPFQGPRPPSPSTAPWPSGTACPWWSAS